ncbi:MAG TPA: CoA transferase [Planctomycetaceae bacterium]|jgi:formyl-CoA transferase/CoA:oxalate CoA-transferase|nr:CoA transferase [Planctomycetaceae bacterium]
MTSAPVERDSVERDSANFDSSKPLAGLRVLDFSHALAGPFCTLILAEYGADIYKLESRDGGDIGRGWGPPDYGDQSSFFMGLNRGKFGISIDLKRPEGIELCLRLIETMDVVIENFRPGTMDRLGLGYDAVQARNPRIIYCSISGYGQDGPSRNEPAMDLIVQSSSGLMSITGTEESGPVRCGYSVADVSAGMFSIMGILMALRSRDKTGRGQYIDVSMFDSMISGMTSCFMIYLGSNALPKPMGSAYPTIVPYRVFTAQDRDFSIAIGSEKLWTAFCAAINRPDLERHADYATNQLRVKNRAAIEGLLSDLFRTRPAAEWLKTLGAGGIPCSLVRNLREVVEDPQSTVRGMFPTVEESPVGPHRVTGAPIKFARGGPSKKPAASPRSAPMLGEYTRATLAELLGLDAPTISKLVESGVVFQAKASRGSA